MNVVVAMTASVVVVERPTITLSTLAKAMGPITLAGLERLLKGHKYKSEGPRRSYQIARRQAIDLFVDRKDLDSEASLRKHEREAIVAMERMKIASPQWVRAVRPSSSFPKWEFEGVTVSMTPDVELEGYLASGSAKFMFTKDPLARGVGSAMAALMWHHRRYVLDIVTTRPCNCIVYEPRLPWLHLPGIKPERQIRNAEVVCKFIAAVWREL